MKFLKHVLRINRSILCSKIVCRSLGRKAGLGAITLQFGCMSTAATAVTDQETQHNKQFMETLPKIIETLVSCDKFKETPDVANWTKQILEYNLKGGKMVRGLSTVYSYEILEKSENLKTETLKLAYVMGWCAEMLQAYLTMLDDVIDESKTRRGKPCWYRNSGVGLNAINDSVLVFTSLFEILKTYFGSKPYYNDVVKLFNETLLCTAIGQHYDITANKITDYNQFTMDLYNTIVKYKAGYYTVKLPLCLGLYLANITDEELHQRTEDVSHDMGKMFQAQDDYIDCFSEESESGKVGTDIQNGKCTWLAVTALQRCTPSQRIVFKACYRSNEPAHVERIKQLYKDLNLPQAYAEFEQTQYNTILQKANSIPGLPPQLFVNFIDLIHNRRR